MRRPGALVLLVSLLSALAFFALGCAPGCRRVTRVASEEIRGDTTFVILHRSVRCYR